MRRRSLVPQVRPAYSRRSSDRSRLPARDPDCLLERIAPDVVVAHLSIVAALQRPCSGRPASPFASCYRANLNPPSWSRQLNEQSALMRALAARPIGPDWVAHG